MNSPIESDSPSISAFTADDRCPCCKTADAELPHVCPFKDEIHNNSEDLCTCCEECERECRMEI
jgi:hypothetical protein